MNRLALLLTVLALFASRTLAANGKECLPERYFSDDDKLTIISVGYSFADNNLNTPWLLQSLTAALKYAGLKGEEVESPARSGVSDGKLLLTFCIDKSFARGEAMFLVVGPREHRLLARRTEKTRIGRAELEEAKAHVASDLKAISYEVMAPIDLLPQASPDWLIVTYADAQRTSNGQLRIDVQVFNPTAIEQQGIDVRLDFLGRSTVACNRASPRPPGQQIAVTIELGKGVAKAFTTEPTFGTELVEREARLYPEVCGHQPRFSLALGHTGLVSKGFNSIRYGFKQDGLVVPRNVRLYLSSFDGGQRDILRWPQVRVQLDGHVFPRALPLLLP